MLPESWTPSWQLRAAGALRSAGTVGCAYAVLWFFFPHVLRAPGTVLVGLLYLPRWLMPARVRWTEPAARWLSPSAGGPGMSRSTGSGKSTRLLRAGADLLTFWWGIVGAVVGLVGVWLLCRAVTRAVSARPGPGLR